MNDYNFKVTIAVTANDREDARNKLKSSVIDLSRMPEEWIEDV